jgi:hypothetical protein
MRMKYRIYVLGEIPSDLKERIAALHTEAILKAKQEDLTACTGKKRAQIGKAVPKAVGRFHQR